MNRTRAFNAYMARKNRATASQLTSGRCCCDACGWSGVGLVSALVTLGHCPGRVLGVLLRWAALQDCWSEVCAGSSQWACCWPVGCRALIGSGPIEAVPTDDPFAQAPVGGLLPAGPRCPVVFSVLRGTNFGNYNQVYARSGRLIRDAGLALAQQLCPFCWCGRECTV